MSESTDLPDDLPGLSVSSNTAAGDEAANVDVGPDQAGEHFPPTAVTCWRCQLEYARQILECPHCGAANRVAAAERVEERKARFAESKALKIVLVTYGVMLAGSFLLAIVVRLGMDPGSEDPSEFNRAILFLEIVHTVVVLIALSLTGLAFAVISPIQSRARAIVGWLVFVAGLPVMIGCNFLYHQWLSTVLNAPAGTDQLGGTWLVLIMLYALQPAVIEELFSRQLCLAAFRPLMGIHFAIFISALMFAMMHIFVPLSVPYLFVLGVYLGYARVYGGTVFLPMALHFAHNLIVIYLEKAS